MNYKYILLFYLAFMTVVSVVLTVHDKHAAKSQKRRIPESTLMTVGFLGGALPMYIVMKIIRHKTKHLKFMIGLPIFFVLHISILVFTELYIHNLFPF